MRSGAFGAVAGSLSCVLLACVQAPALHAQAYPSKPIRLIVPQAAGSATDLAGRIVARELGEAMGQQVIVDNRAGAGGALGAELAARAAPDGYTLVLANISTHGVNPALYRKLPYDAVRDFRPIALTSFTANVLVAHPSLPVRTTRELVAFARARPGQLNFGSAGNGSSQHLATELFRSAVGIDTVHVAYKGGPPAMTALVAGEVAWMMPTLALALPHMRTQRIRGLAVTSLGRSDEAPDLPPVAEVVPGFEVVSWYGLAGPAGLPDAITAQLNREAGRAVSSQAARKGLAAAGMTPRHGTPEEFAALIRGEIERWTKVARSANIALN